KRNIKVLYYHTILRVQKESLKRIHMKKMLNYFLILIMRN
ncbi:uncharacterized protein METZ01_LOCUS200793, partial [marine metagenome]